MEKNKLLMIVIIILLVVTLGTITAISWYVIGMVNKDPGEAEITPAPVVEVTMKELEVVSFGEVTRNLLKGEDNKSTHLIQATYSVSVYKPGDTDGEVVATLNDKVEIARDIINSVVGNMTYEEISAVNGMDRLKEKILIKLRDAFQTTLIWEVYVSGIYFN